MDNEKEYQKWLNQFEKGCSLLEDYYKNDNYEKYKETEDILRFTILPKLNELIKQRVTLK